MFVYKDWLGFRKSDGILAELQDSDSKIWNVSDQEMTVALGGFSEEVFVIPKYVIKQQLAFGTVNLNHMQNVVWLHLPDRSMSLVILHYDSDFI